MSLPGKDTFEDAITRFRNRSIHTYAGHCLLFRGQILQDGEFGVQSGWDTATNQFIMEHLIRLDFLRRNCKSKPGPQTAVESWLDQRADAVTQFRRMIDRAQMQSPVAPAVLAQVAIQARNLLDR